MQTCPVCAKQNPTGVEYCEDCGAALTRAGQPAAQPAPVSIPVTVPSRSAAAERPAAGGAPAAVATAPPLTDNGAASGTAAPAAPSTGVAAAPAPGAPAAPEDVGPPPGEPAAAAAASAPAPAAGQRPRLIVKRYGAPTGDEIPLLGDRLLVGRFDPETGPVDVDLSAAPEAEHISRQHGELYREPDGRWFVRDLGSTNGVFVQTAAAATFGPRITAPRELANGDEVAFGNARFLFRTD